MRRPSGACVALLLLALPAPALAQDLRVELETPEALREGDRREVIARVHGAGPHPLLLTPRSEGTAVEVVRGRLLRAEARDPEAEVLEFRVPVVARSAGAAVLRVEAAGYSCEARCRLVRAEASLVLEVAPAARSRRKRGAGAFGASAAEERAGRRGGLGDEEGASASGGRVPGARPSSSLSPPRLPASCSCSAPTRTGVFSKAKQARPAPTGADGDGADGDGADGDDASRTDSGERARGERTSSLSWVRLPGAEGCIASAPLARAVEDQLDRHVFVSAADADLAVEGRAERVDGRWRATIVVTDREGAPLGERTLESDAEGCDELGEMTTVAVALMIDPLTAPADEPDDPPRERVIVRTETVEVPVEVPAEPAPPRRGWRVEIDSALVGSIGLSPLLNLGGMTEVIVEPPDFVPLTLHAAVFPFSRADAQSGGHADFFHLHGGIQICPLGLREGGLALHGCLGVDAGAVFVVGGDLDVDEGERVIGQGHVQLRGHWDVIGPLTIRLGLHFLIPFRQDDPFTVAGVAFYNPEPVAGMADLGVGLHFD